MLNTADALSIQGTFQEVSLPLAASAHIGLSAEVLASSLLTATMSIVPRAECQPVTHVSYPLPPARLHPP